MQPGSPPGPPFRVHGHEEARADVRRLDQVTAMRIFEWVLHFARTGAGDVTRLHGDFSGNCRLRLGDWRVLFSLHENLKWISGVRHRSKAYR